MVLGVGWWRHVLGLRLLIAIMVALAGIAFVIATAVPDSGLAKWAVPAAIALQILIFVKAVADLAAEAEQRETLDQQRLLEGVGGGLLLGLTDMAPDVEFHHWGIHIYRLSYGFLWNRRLPWPKRAQLRRMLRLRITRAPRTTGIIWRWGKGVIGRAMEHDQFWAYPVHVAYRVYRNEKKAWESAGVEVNLNLNYADLERCAQYGWVFAHPIRDRKGKVRGVISADLPSGVAENRNWDQHRIQEELQQAAHATSTLWFTQEPRER